MPSGFITVNPDTEESFKMEAAEGEVIEIGRKDTGDKRKLVLPYPEVSGKHAEIRCKPTGWTIVDLASTNGTVVNGSRLQSGREYPLRMNDLVEIALYKIKVEPPFDPPMPTSHVQNYDDDDRDGQDKTQFRIHLINATILVGDIKGFTSLMEQYAQNPERVMKAAQSIFEVLNEEIHRHSGQLEKIAGDAIMAYWAGGDSKDIARSQARFACETALELKKLSAQLARDKAYWPFMDHPMMLDMALATGPVAAGALGHAAANTNLLGDTANLVFRLEKLIDDQHAGEVVVEGVTYELAKDFFDFEHMGSFSVKGRQKQVDVHRLIAAK